MNAAADPTDDALEQRLEAARERHRAGDRDGAETEYRTVLAARPDHAEAHHLLAVARLQAGDLARAFELAERAVALEPSAQRLNTLGSLHLHHHRRAEAIAAFEAALAHNSDLLAARLNLADALRDGAEPAAAERHYRVALDAAPDDVDTLNNLAALLMETGRRGDAHDLLRRGAAAAPDEPAVLVNLANNAERLNRVDEARQAAMALRRREPGSVMAALVLARLERRTGDATAALVHLDGLVDAASPAELQAPVLFERGQILDRLGRHDDAFAAWRHAQDARRSMLPPEATDAAPILGHIDAMRAWLAGPAAARPRRIAGNGLRSPEATMPGWAATRRSRSVVPERGKPTKNTGGGRPSSASASAPVAAMAVAGPASHARMASMWPRIGAASVASGERSPLPAIRRGLAAAGSYPGAIAALDAAARARLRDDFWAEAETLGVAPAPGQLLFDKMPMNLIDLPLARFLFPTAKVVMALRDPRDSVLSCYMQPFAANVATAAMGRLDDAARLCAGMLALWLQMRDGFGDDGLEVRYEDLVADPLAVARRVVDFLGVPWNAVVAGYRDAAPDRAVATPSYAEVEAPVSDRAAGRWQHYVHHLAPVLRVLAPAVAAFGYDADGAKG